MADGNKKQEKSLLQRLLSTEAAIFAVGVGCIVYGLAQGLKLMQLFFGVCIVGGSFALHFVRNKDWDAHWAQMEQVRKAHELRTAQEKENRENR